MKIFNGLDDRQAIEFNGVYVIHLSRGEYVSPSGENVKINMTGQLTHHQIEGWQRVKKTQPRVLHYKTKEGNELSVDEYRRLQEQYEELKEKGFPDLDTEFDLKKRIAEYNRATAVMSEAEVTHEPIEITVIGSAEDTGSEFIETPFKYCQTSFKSSGIYKVHSTAISVDEFKKLGSKFTKDRFSCDGKLRFAKINGDFVFSHMSDVAWIDRQTSQVVGTIEEARELEKSIRQQVVNAVYLALIPVPADDVTLNEVLRQLGRIQDTVRGLDVKVKDQSSQRVALVKIRELRGRVEESINEYIQETE